MALGRKQKAGLPFGSRSLAALGILLTTIQGFHPKMLMMLEAGETAAWLLLLCAGLVGSFLAWPVAAALRTIPNGSLAELIRSVLGRPGLIVTALLYGAGILFASGMVLRETSEMALSAVFPHTPQTFITVAMLVGSVYVAWGEASALVHLGRILLPLLLVSVAMILLGTMGWGEARYLLPLLGPGVPELVTVLPGAVAVQFPAIMLTLVADRVSDRQQLGRWLPAVPAIGGAILAALEAVLLMVFAYPIGVNIPFPLHTAARMVMGGRFFERLEGIWVFVWAAVTIVMLGALLHGVSVLYTKAFRLPWRQAAVLPFAAIVLTVAFFPTDQAQTIEWHLTATPTLFYALFLYPAVIALVVLFRQRRRAA